MGKKTSGAKLWLTVLVMLALVLDSQTAFSGTTQGIELCIRTVVPSLFPFFVISTLFTSALMEHPASYLRPLGRLCGIPISAEGIFMLGLLGGYPVGAQAVTQAWVGGSLSEKDAKRLLGFCNNCGPSFLFGITAVLFDSSNIPWIIWGIHLFSALITGILLPEKSNNKIEISINDSRFDLANAVRNGIRNLANVCGWILIARCVTAFLEKWILFRIPLFFRVCVFGFLELTNGCVALAEIDSECIRFLTVSGFLAFGGLCVSFQTVSVTGALGTGWYFPGKILQLSVSILLAHIISLFLYPEAHFHPIFLVLPAAVYVIISRIIKKDVAFSGKFMYNHIQKKSQRRQCHAFPP